MVRGDRQDRLGRLLRGLGMDTAVAPPLPRSPGLDQPVAGWVRELYTQLGGVLQTPLLKPVGWDLSLRGSSGRLVVELDEEQHFTRYRLTTLAAPWAEGLPWTDDYRRFCLTREDAALLTHSSGGFWESIGSATQFGAAAPHGDLSGSGSPSWKQRALYDAMRDAVAASGGVRLARLSVHDDLGGVTLNDVLEDAAEFDDDALRDLLDRRTSGTRAAAPGAVLAETLPR
ncbi:hypothetical protein ACFXP7_11570 [Microbacterium sp. P06]|uniref:DUF7255 family protein n=1 Tax=Microbacterium sp. P06 TaxID=3366949 RepID=UPI003746B3C3